LIAVQAQGLTHSIFLVRRRIGPRSTAPRTGGKLSYEPAASCAPAVWRAPPTPPACLFRVACGVDRALNVPPAWRARSVMPSRP